MPKFYALFYIMQNLILRCFLKKGRIAPNFLSVVYMYVFKHVRGAYDKFPDFFRMGI